MHIVLLGSNGQVGWELQRALAPLGRLTALNRQAGDLTRPEELTRSIRALQPTVIVNAAAYTAVDRAESEQKQAALVNATAVEALAREAEALGAWLVHFSTDYVFSGEGASSWQETDAPAPLNVYGASKLAGEQAIMQHCSRHLVFRTSWVYATRGNNFAKTMLRLGQERAALNVVADQVGAPTNAALIADVTAHALRRTMAQSALAGLYHLAAAGETSWHGYAAFVFEQARNAGLPLVLQALHPIATHAWPTPATRPLNSRLNCRKLETAFDIMLPHWQQGLLHTLSEILEPLIEQA